MTSMEKLRRAVGKIRKETVKAKEEGRIPEDFAAIVEELVNEVLETPLRNCDVGTVSGQHNRFISYCSDRTCDTCPFEEAACCEFAWGQIEHKKD